jgi:hypothetical protein
MPEPTVFVSYSHDSDAHKDWTTKLTDDLRHNGVDAILDRHRLSAGQDLSMFMQNGIATADRVLMICTEPYIARAEGGSGGVGFERQIITAELIQSIDTDKFIPIIRNNLLRRIPNFLGPRFYIDFNDDNEYSNKLEELLRELLGAPSLPEPAVGSNPFSSSVPPIIGVTSPPQPGGTMGVPLDDPWFQIQEDIALRGIAAIPLSGSMELRFKLQNQIRKSQLELLDAVRGSRIRTFGWPIGILLENREEYRPQPLSDGIKAEVPIQERLLGGSPSYDYWALRMTGEYYLLQSLFEDQRRENMIFFNTRIVRVAEAFLFASKLYNNLGVNSEEPITARVAHRGLSGRTLGSSNRDRDIYPSRTAESNSQTEISTLVGSLRANIVDYVKQILDPMFALFDFQTIDEGVYRDIIERFIQGHVT